jgi:hypothetical protein
MEELSKARAHDAAARKRVAADAAALRRAASDQAKTFRCVLYTGPHTTAIAW